MKILIDMDDVLEQLVPAWVEYMNVHYGTNTKPEDVCDWNMTLAFPTVSPDIVYKAPLHDDFWDDVKPMPGADEALKKLIAEGHEIYVVTASYYQTLPVKMDNVLFKWFPYLKWEQVIISSNKQIIAGDILIDDGPHNLTGGSYRKILFSQPHNRNFDEKSVGAVRVHNWDEAYAEIQKIVKENK